VPCTGDLKVIMYHRAPLLPKDEILHFWFNTFFVPEHNQQQAMLQSSSCSCLNAPTRCSNARHSNVPTGCSCSGSSPAAGPSRFSDGYDRVGRFVSVVQVANNHPHTAAGGFYQRSGAGRAAAASQRILILGRNEMEVDKRLGPRDIQVRMFFITA